MKSVEYQLRQAGAKDMWKEITGEKDIAITKERLVCESITELVWGKLNAKLFQIRQIKEIYNNDIS